MSVSQHERRDPETKAAKCNSAIIHLITPVLFTLSHVKMACRTGPINKKYVKPQIIFKKNPFAGIYYQKFKILI